MGRRTHAEQRAARAVVDRIRAALGPHARSCRVLLPDAAGRFRVAASFGPAPRLNGPGTRIRRAVFADATPRTLDLSGDGLALGAFPVLDGERPMGVLEVVAPVETLAEHGPMLGSLAAEAPGLSPAAAEHEGGPHATQAMRSLLSLTATLLQTDRRTQAVAVAAEACARYFGTPTAGLVPDRSGVGWYLVAFPGVGLRRLAAGRRAASEAPARGPRASVLDGLARAVGDATGVSDPRPIDASTAVLLVGADPDRDEGFASALSVVLEHALRHQYTVRLARERNERFDLGIAWTAHELRGPIAAARHAVEHAMKDPDGADGREMLERARAELEHLGALVEPLLRWSAGGASLERRRVDLARIVRAATVEAALEVDEDRIRLRTPASVPVEGDDLQLQSAVANVLRNALAYSPGDTPVDVDLFVRDGVATVGVRDHGPGVAPADRDRIFDPLARGGAARARSGRGLGLYIARRAIEAHGGAIRIVPTRRGSLFTLEVPAISEEASPSGS